MPHRPPVIGLLGGIASGKSFVADWMRDHGAVVLDADRAGHEVLRQPEVEQIARERWGGGIFGSDGAIDRKALARIVFAPTEQGGAELRFLEQITHPRIGDKLQHELAARAGGPDVAALILDAPVLLKAGWDKFCDRVIYVDAPHTIRLARARTRGWSDEEFARREASQESLAVKRSHADVVIDNSGTPQATAEQLARAWPELIRQPTD